jgi:hypothetical protein
MIETEIATPTAILEVPAVVDPGEEQLVDEVGNLWQAHNQAKTSLHQTRDELKLVRMTLSQRLYELKSLLSRPGRGGAWSGFLVSQKIPRSTADRLVRGFAKMNSADPDSCATEQVLEPTEAMIHRYVRALWPRLSKVLTTRESVQIFTAELHRMAEQSFAGNRSLSATPPKGSALPSYLRHLNLPVGAVLDNAAHA